MILYSHREGKPLRIKGGFKMNNYKKKVQDLKRLIDRIWMNTDLDPDTTARRTHRLLLKTDYIEEPEYITLYYYNEYLKLETMSGNF